MDGRAVPPWSSGPVRIDARLPCKARGQVREGRHADGAGFGELTVLGGDSRRGRWWARICGVAALAGWGAGVRGLGLRRAGRVSACGSCGNGSRRDTRRDCGEAGAAWRGRGGEMELTGGPPLSAKVRALAGGPAVWALKLSAGRAVARGERAGYWRARWARGRGGNGAGLGAWELAVTVWAGPSGERVRRVGRCWAASWVWVEFCFGFSFYFSPF